MNSVEPGKRLPIVRDLRIAFLACNRVARRWRENPSYYYRCDNPGVFLADQGAMVTTCHLNDAPSPSTLDLVVFHRPRANWRLRWLLWRYRRAGVAVVADVDDLVFDERLVRESPAIRNRRVPLPIQWRIFRLQRKALSWFSHVAVSTETLAGHVHRLFPEANIAILFNSVFWSWRFNTDPPPTPLAAPPYVITYMSGTRSHDRDFGLIAGQLQRFLVDHPDTTLRITGPLKFQMDVPEGQLVHSDRVPFEHYRELFKGVWVNLAPLEATPFNACKSALKAMEAGFMGVPTLYSNNPDMDRLAGEGVFRVEDGDWYGALERLRDPARYAAAVANLRERILPLADVAKQGEELLTLLQASDVREPL